MLEVHLVQAWYEIGAESTSQIEMATESLSDSAETQKDKCDAFIVAMWSESMHRFLWAAQGNTWATVHSKSESAPPVVSSGCHFIFLLLPVMSLKVPKANNIQLFKDGYKVHSTHLFSNPIKYY